MRVSIHQNFMERQLGYFEYQEENHEFKAAVYKLAFWFGEYMWYYPKYITIKHRTLLNN